MPTWFKVSIKVLPWAIVGILLLLLWNRPIGGGGANEEGTVLVAGPAALTPTADNWNRQTRECPPPPGSTAPTIKVVYRDVPPEEVERLAKKYAATVDNGLSTAPLSRTAQGASGTGERPGVLSAAFGEYYGPTAPYGSTFLAGLRPDGEFEARFDPLPPPKFRLNWVYGGGATLDTSKLFNTQTGSDPTQNGSESRVYAFLEPFQTKRVYWRLSGGLRDSGPSWEPYVAITAEWRSDPWVRKSKHGLKAVKVD